MSFEAFEKYLRSSKSGKDLLEAEEKFLKLFDELDSRLSNYILWLTGLAIGEIAFMVSKEGAIYKCGDQFFLEATTLLLFSILSGLFYQFMRVVAKMFSKQAASYERQIAAVFWGKNSELEEKDFQSVENLRVLWEQYIKKSLSVPRWMNLSAFLNVCTYFSGTIALVLLMAKKLLCI